MQEDEKKGAVLSALRAPKWRYRTVDGISKETRISIDDVKRVLDESPQIVRVSRIRNRNGKILYASKERVSALGDLWTAARAISKRKVTND